MANVLGSLDAAFDQGVVEMLGLGRSVGGEVRGVQDEPGAQILTLRQKREQLHPARIDPSERLVRGRQAGPVLIISLGPARDGDAAFAVATEDIENVL